MSDTQIDDGTRAILARRAERLGAPLGRAEEDADDVWLATFSLEAERFAFPLQALRGAVPARALTPVPLAPRGAVGLVRFEGTLLAVWSLASLLGERSWPRDPTLLVVLEPEPGRLVGVDCAEVPMPLAVSRRAVAEAPPDGIFRRVPASGEVPALTLIDLPLLLRGVGSAVPRGH